MDIKDASEAKKSAKPTISRLRQEREKRAWTQSQVAEHIGSTRINVSRWENGNTPSPYYRQKLAELFGKSVQELGFIAGDDEERSEGVTTPVDAVAHTPPMASSPIWNIPYRRNPYFTGRETILQHLYTVLRGRKSVALTQTQAISGLGGIGKTQIAVEYAYRYRDHYQAIFWIDASTREAFSDHFLLLATALDLPEQHGQTRDIIIRAVKRWLSAHTQWLLILDNVERLELIVDFLPTDTTGDVLLTTRLQALGTVAQSIEVEKMGLDEGVMLLLRRAKIIAPDASLDGIIDKDSVHTAAEIATTMDGLPLALDQAAAYIEETHCGLTQYLNLFAIRRKELLLRRGRLPIDYPNAVATTWSLSFQQVEQESSTTTELLRLFAFLNAEAIPEELISLGAIELGPMLGPVANDPLQVNNMIELLLHYSLIGRTPEVGSLSIHRLVQAVLIDGMDTDARRMWAERTIRALNRAFPHVELHNWHMCQRLLPHVQMCQTYLKEYSLAFPEAARLLSEAASYLIARGSYGQAEQLLLISLEIRQNVLWVNHPDRAATLNDLGALYQNQGKYPQAELLLQEALALRLQVLGEEHLEVAETLHNLANLYRALGAYTKAEPFYVKALHMRQRLLEADHSLVAQSYYGLAKLYHSLEKYQQAEHFGVQALRIQEQRLGTAHPLIASTLNMLAKIYQGQNKLDLAEETNLRALTIRENTSGVTHPHVATITNSLVEIYHARGQYRDVEPLIAKALKIHEQSLGTEHPFMAYSLSNRATNLFLRGDYIQAESSFKEALLIREQNLGTDHPHTASTYYELAKLYAVLERDEEAEPFYRKALSIRERAFGHDHPIVVRTLEHYATLLKKLKKTHEAFELEARIQAIKAQQSALESTNT